MLSAKMRNDILLLSIWRVDPIGGEFVDWPEDPTKAELCSEREFMGVLGAKLQGYRILSKIISQLPGAWIPHADLIECEQECSSFLQENATEIEQKLVDAQKPLTGNIKKLRDAIIVALEIPNAGVHIG